MPGTGKTTVGRVLAHRLKSKFFLIDGSFISGTGRFYREVQEVIEAAKRNRPSVVFIDDTDVIFEHSGDAGLYRYLLSLLDGLDSEGIREVCLMLAAMDVSRLPPALIRSGRIDLWLELHLPDERARRQILEDRLGQGYPADLERPHLDPLVTGSAGMTGADMRRLVVDARHLLAYDLANSRSPKPMQTYFETALLGIKTNKEKLARAAAQAAARSKE